MQVLQRKWVVLFGGVVLIVIAYFFLSTPLRFSPTTVVIEQGTTASQVAQKLTNAHVLSYATPLWLLLRITGADGTIHAGTYRFNNSETIFRIANRLATADYGLPLVRITHKEGETVRELSIQVENAFPNIVVSDFLEAAKPNEGYLFPDTYLFPPSTDMASIILAMRTNFNTKVAPLQGAIATSSHSLADIVTMASLIEKEVRTDENRRIVAGILWNRIKLGMPLQVDAVFGYIFNRDTYSPSHADLKVDSPYNTYTHKGLPPGPINNPGLNAIQAVLNPVETKYLYYLTGSDNLMHYATTYAAHQANRKKYLNK